MARYERFTILCDHSERKAIVELAAHLQRSQSDAVRFVLLEAVRRLTEATSSHPPGNKPADQVGINNVS